MEINLATSLLQKGSRTGEEKRVIKGKMTFYSQAHPTSQRIQKNPEQLPGSVVNCT